MQKIRFVALAAVAATTFSACATKGFVRRGLDEQRVALGQERSERVAGDSASRAELAMTSAAIRAELASLRTDLGMLRTEFGTKISAMEGQVTFAMPVHFDFDAAAVRPQDEAALTKFAQVAQAHYKGALITVEGFADPAGGAAYNLRLSRNRADAVRDFLLTKGFDAGNIRTVGYGKARLVRPGAEKGEAGAELNRRVTFVIETASTTSTVAALSMP